MTPSCLALLQALHRSCGELERARGIPGWVIRSPGRITFWTPDRIRAEALAGGWVNDGGWLTVAGRAQLSHCPQGGALANRDSAA